MPLPDASHALVERQKLTEYLLSPGHLEGAPKAAFFARIGYTLENWEAFRDALLQHGRDNDVVRQVESPHGVRYIVEGPFAAPARGIQIILRSVWVVEPQIGAPRLVTAYPRRIERGARI